MKTKLIVCLLFAFTLVVSATAQNKCYDPDMATLLSALGLPARPPSAGIRSSREIVNNVGGNDAFLIANLSDSVQEVTILGYDSTGTPVTPGICVILPAHTQSAIGSVSVVPFGTDHFWVEFVDIPRKAGGPACSPLANVNALLLGGSFSPLNLNQFTTPPEETLSALAGNRIEVFETSDQKPSPVNTTVLPSSCVDLNSLQKQVKALGSVLTFFF